LMETFNRSNNQITTFNNSCLKICKYTETIQQSSHECMLICRQVRLIHPFYSAQNYLFCLARLYFHPILSDYLIFAHAK
jgi:hypothetical protein